ncbi:MAG: tRNA pseudouridine(38-40) synthase TruA [Bacteroidia bacterium]|nr:MAG: tRNA pseudouridine(38-40) synthase TruA [Bacteroidia bacterium]
MGSSRRYRLDLAYRGSAYHGWQRQPNALSVQEVLEGRLGQLLRAPIELTGCGRTDTGVHALRYVAHFDGPEGLTAWPKDGLVRSLNGMLPSDIVVYSLAEVAADFHARFDARLREYRYVLQRRPNPFTLGLATPYYHELSLEAMQRGAQALLDHEDFASFCKSGGDAKTTICRLARSEWAVEGDQWVYTVAADRFLRNMVRAIVGTLLEMGRGRITLGELHDILRAKSRSRAGASVSPEGLYLSRVEY